MFAMLKQFFSAITLFFVGLEKNAQAYVNLSTWGEEASGAFADVARKEREQKLWEMNEKFEAQKASRAKQLRHEGAAATKQLTN